MESSSLEQACWDVCLELMQREMVPALGCTEPVAIALACAKARSLLPAEDGEAQRVVLCASRDMLKNAMAVVIPHTNLYGAEYACALGAAGGDASLLLEVLSTLTPQAVERAREMVAGGAVSMRVADCAHPIYIEATVYGNAHTATAVICGTHANFCRLLRDDEILFEKPLPQPEEEKSLPAELSLRAIFDFAQRVPLEKLELVREAIRLNTAISKDGLTNPYGLRSGQTMQRTLAAQPHGGSVNDRAIMRTLAAVDARMDGCNLAVMSNSGSGNQGITATVPVWSVAQDMGVDDETALRAVALSHMTTIYIKEHLERLSSLCGAIVAAIGACCAIAWLSGGDYDAIERTLVNTLASVTGQICDGAKAGCALKVSTALASAFQGMTLALEGICVGAIEGIVGSDAEITIDNLGRLTQEGMRETDKAIWDIMLQKQDTTKARD